MLDASRLFNARTSVAIAASKTLICIDLSNVADLVDIFLLVLLKQCAERRAGGVTTIDQSDIRGLVTA